MNTFDSPGKPNNRIARLLDQRGVIAAMYLYGAAALGAVLIVTGYTAYVYHLGGVGPKAQLAALVSSYQAAQKVHEAEDAKKTAQSTTLITQKDAENAQNIKVIGESWNAYIARLPKRPNPGSANQGQKPVSIASTVCQDQASNNLVSTAVSRYRSEVIDSINEFRLGVSQLLSACDQNTAQLINLQDAVAGLATVNAP